MEDLRQIAYKQARGVDNMALDAAMLLYGGAGNCAIWRLYGWSEPAVTFGYSQNWHSVQASLQGFDGVCIRRLTGGGIVDHRRDLTYALSLPASHPLFRVPAQRVYAGLHQGIANLLKKVGFHCALAPCRDNMSKIDPSLTRVCFQASAPFDVIDSRNNIKQAGAAMKRNRSGLLIQGSLARDALPGLDEGDFQQRFGTFLAEWLHLPKGDPVEVPAGQLAAERERFSSRDWNQRR